MIDIYIIIDLRFLMFAVENENEGAGVGKGGGGETDRQETGEGQERQDHEGDEDATTSIHKQEGDISDLGGKHDGPRQVKLSHYPQDKFGVKKRSFNSKWFESFLWLKNKASSSRICSVFSTCLITSCSQH